ncbi:MAG: hypothetical protein M3X11_21585 [Acidobacteriota bacterium]|nr:hypothetical protein [Acidobacteriota bacterium]
MNNKIMNATLTLAATAVLSLAVLAQGAVEKKVSFYLDGKVGTELVKKGTYTVAFPEAETGTVEIKVGKKVVSAPFTKRQNNAEADADKMTYLDNGDGTRTIASITPRGQKYTLVLESSGSVAKQ